MNDTNIISFTRVAEGEVSSEISFDEAISLILDFKFEDARDLLYRMIEDGHEDAYVYLGKVYELEPDKNPILNYEKAYFYYNRAIETTGSVDAHISIAHFFSMGFLGKVDEKSAMNIYLDLVNQGFSKEGFLFWMVGARYAKGQGVKADLSFASDFLKRGWEEKHIPSLYWLGYVSCRKGKYIRGCLSCLRALALWSFFAIFDKHSSRIYT